MTLSLALSAVIMALVGAGHCATMCGPITLALVSRPDRNKGSTARLRQPLAAHVGRIGTYALLGALTATSSAAVTNFLRDGVLQTAWLLLPNLLLLFSALYLMGFQQAHAPVEAIGRRLWQSMEWARNISTARSGVTGNLLKGAVWGMLPCGMIYSALGLAVLAANPLDGAFVMAIFGASTLPVLLAIGLLSQGAVQKLRQPNTRRMLGAALLLLVVWNVYLLPARLSGVRHSFLC